MVTLAAIIVIIVSLVSGFYGIALLAILRKKYPFDYINSLFYYQVLHFLFGLYGILGNLAMEKILLKYGLSNPNIAGIALLLPLFGVPFIVAGWFMLIKVASEIVNKKLPQFIAIVYFTFSTALAFVFGLYMQKFPELNSADFSGKIIVVFYSFDTLIAVYFSATMFINSRKKLATKQKKYILTVAFVVISLSIFKAISLHFSRHFLLAGVYFLILFFAGNLLIIFITKSYLQKIDPIAENAQNQHNDLFAQFGISNREKEIIEEICKGKTNQEIADTLFISLQTVKDHTHNIFRKVEVKNRVQLSRIFRKE